MMISLTYKISLAKKKKKIYTSICSFNYAEACVFLLRDLEYLAICTLISSNSSPMHWVIIEQKEHFQCYKHQ